MRTSLVTLFVCLLAGSSAIAQVPFHWEMTNAPGELPLVALEVAPNGDLCALLDQAHNNFYGAGYKSLLRRHGTTWSEIPLPHLYQFQDQMTFGGKGSMIFLLDTGLYRISTDGTQGRIGNAPIRLLTTDFAGNLLTVIDSFSIQYSTDEGNSWTPIPNPPLRHGTTDRVNGVAHDNFGGKLYATTDSAVFESSNMGTTWEMILGGGTPYGRVTVGHDGRLWVEWTIVQTGSYDEEYTLSFFRRAGDTNWHGYQIPWTPTRMGPPAVDRNDLALIPFRTSIDFSRDTAFVGSVDFGTPTESAYATTATVDSSGHWYANFAGETREVFETPEPNPWTDWKGYDTIPGSTATVTPFPFGLLEEDNAVRFFSPKGSGQWLKLHSPSVKDTFLAVASAQVRDRIFVGINCEFTPMISRDSGRTWKFIDSLASGLTAMVVHTDTIYAERPMVHGNCTIIRSTDDGTTWLAPPGAYDGAGPLNDGPHCLDSSGNLYAGQGLYVYKTTNFGQNWDAGFVHVGFNLYISWLLASRDQIYANDDDSWTYRSLDGGKTYRVAPDTFLHYLPVDPRGCIAYSGNKLLYTSDTNTAPQDIRANLTGLTFSTMTRGPAGELLLTTVDGGMYRGVGYPATLAVRRSDVAQSGAVVYPNPASSVLTISGLDVSSLLIEAVNAIGASQVLPCTRAGDNIQCDVSHLPPGQYWLRVLPSGVRTSMPFVIQR